MCSLQFTGSAHVSAKTHNLCISDWQAAMIATTASRCYTRSAFPESLLLQQWTAHY